MNDKNVEKKQDVQWYVAIIRNIRQNKRNSTEQSNSIFHLGNPGREGYDENGKEKRD